MKKSNGKITVTFYQNPFYDYMFGTIGVIVPSKRAGYKQDPVTKKAVEFTLPKGTREFERYIKSWLSKNPKPGWPITSRILIAVSIGLVSEDYNRKDIDNTTKSLLDALQGVAYENDRQVDALHVVKYKSDLATFMVGIKELTDDDPGWYYPQLFKEEPWGDEQIYQLSAKNKWRT
jgi:Holliday junction resolvase RusA-like endonuclease